MGRPPTSAVHVCLEFLAEKVGGTAHPRRIVEAPTASGKRSIAFTDVRDDGEHLDLVAWVVFIVVAAPTSSTWISPSPSSMSGDADFQQAVFGWTRAATARCQSTMRSLTPPSEDDRWASAPSETR